MCMRVSEYVRLCVRFLFALAFVPAHTLTHEGGDRFVFVGFNGAALCVCLAVCVCGTVSVCGWLANNKNEECRQVYRSALNSKGAQLNFLR